MIIRLVLICVVILLVFGTLINLLRGRKSLGVNGLKVGIIFLNKKKWLALLLILCFLGGYIGWECIEQSRMSEVTIGLNYAEASSGLNPNGTKFNSSEIISEEILNRAIATAGWENVSAKELQECLEISSSADTIRLIDEEPEPSIVTEYTVTYTKKRNVADGIAPEEVTGAIADAYYENFMENYAVNDSILYLEFGDIEELEYLEISDYFALKAAKLIGYLDDYVAEDGSYRSEATGETFASLQAKVNDFSTIELERFYSFAVQNGLAKDREQYIAKKDYDNLMLNINHMTYMSQYNVRLEAIDMYAPEMATIVLVPTEDETSEFYMSRTQIGVDYFAEEARQALQEATSIQEEMGTNDYEISQVSNSVSEQSVYEQAEQMIERLTEELIQLAEECQIIVEEYTAEKQNNYITLRYDNKMLWEKIPYTRTLIYTVLFSVLVCVYIISVGINHNDGKRGGK